MTQRIESGSYCKVLKLRKIILFILRKSKIILIFLLHKNKLELTKEKK